MKIEAIHDFHDPAYAAEWAERFKISPHRAKLFQDMGDLLEKHCPSDGQIVELGIGPAYLAYYLLSRFPKIQYTGLDFSRAMLDIAEERLKEFKARTQFIQFDLTQSKLKEVFANPVDAIVSTWALHDLYTQENIKNVYADCRTVLKGILINGDFVKPIGVEVEYEGGRIELQQHLGMLKELGYQEVECLFQYEASLENPTTANNYACMVGFI